jgi:ABC-type sugar transport system ATPase subunit
MSGGSQLSDTGRAAHPGLLAIDAQGIEKRFGGTLALKGVSVKARSGTIHALVGENGAGKSTFLGVIAGRIAPSAGALSVFGQPGEFGDPRHAKRLGIAAIYQELTIIPAMTTQANVFLGQTPTRGPVIAQARMKARFRELCERLRVTIPVDKPAGRLSVADQQMLEIMRGVQSEARLLLFDEPTTSLAPPERDSLFRVMRELREQGATMMFVSHNLEEVLDIADMVTVFRDGMVTASAPRWDWTRASLVRAMIGHDLLPAATASPKRTRAQAPPLLSARAVSLANAVHDIDIEVHEGEIVGVGGLVGSGRTSLLRALAGLEPHSTGTLRIDGALVPWPRTPRAALRLGIALVPEDRKAQGLVLGMNVMSNITMASFERVSRAGIMSDRAMNQQSRAIAREFGLAETRVGTIVRDLSGGNQQKVLLGKWRHHRPKVLLVDEPTRGIDVGAKEEILATLRRLAEDGLGIIIVSSELEEVVAASERVLVLSEGRAVAELAADDGPISVGDILSAAFKVGSE